MTLKEAMIVYGRANLTETNAWYRWSINPIRLPAGIVLPEGNSFAQNVALKIQLSRLYASADNHTKKELTRYYIAVWGGIKKNSDEKIRSYALDTPTSLIAKGSQGIASWSKALCLRNPSDYAIYDARVAVSLNCLQIAEPVERPSRFPLLYGQNNLMNEGRKKLRQYAIIHGWPTVQDGIFYQKYNNILSFAGKLLDVNACALEMLLFAKAPELLQTAFPEEL
jgi:hypothetical protein